MLARCLFGSPTRRLVTATGASYRLSSTAAQLDDDNQQQLQQRAKSILEHEDYFKVKELAAVEALYKARVHFGHHKGTRNEHMKEYLFGCRSGVDVIDLDKSSVHMGRALNFLAHMAYRRAVILFVMHSPQHGHAVEKAARECGEYSHTHHWPVGLLTNQQFGEYSTNRYPDVCVFLSTLSGSHQEHPAVAECSKVGIATVGVADSNVNPTMLTYPIPGNDDSTASINFYLQAFSRAIKTGKLTREIDDMRERERKGEKAA